MRHQTPASRWSISTKAVSTARSAPTCSTGLGRRQKAVPARWFYDERGSGLFEEITRLPEYYPTRAETEILQAHCGRFRGA